MPIGANADPIGFSKREVGGVESYGINGAGLIVGRSDVGV